MDAKTLRAALAAALRVTVSTSLIGCGGHTSTEGGSGGTSSHAKAPPTAQPDEEYYPDQSQPPGGVLGTDRNDPIPVTTGGVATSGGASGNAAGGMMVSAAGASHAGAGGASHAGAGGASHAGAGGAGPKLPTRCEAVEACVSTLEVLQIEWGEPLPSSAEACCQTVIESLSGAGQIAAMCDNETFASLYDRFMSSSARGACCAEPETWQHQACTPWGPAVPPELPNEALAAWELAA